MLSELTQLLINIVRVALSSILVQREKVTILLTKSNFNGDTTLPENMAKTFLTDETNKTKLNQMIAEICTVRTFQDGHGTNNFASQII